MLQGLFDKEKDKEKERWREEGKKDREKERWREEGENRAIAKVSREKKSKSIMNSSTAQE